MAVGCLKISLFNLIPKHSGLDPIFEGEEGSVQGLGKMNGYPILYSTKQGLGGDQQVIAKIYKRFARLDI